MYYVTKRIEISAAHRLELDYASKCSNMHGHNWIITVHCRARQLNSNGMVTDFTAIKEAVTDKFDHKILNDEVNFNPTAENIARYLCDSIENCYRVDVQESEGNTASYEREDIPRQ